MSILDLGSLPQVPCKHRRPRTRPAVAITIHTAECPSKPGAAMNVARYMASIDRVAGIHFVVGAGPDEYVQCADLTETTPHCYAPSAWSIGIEHVGYAHSAPSSQVISNSARLVAEICQQLSIPNVRLTVPQVKAARPGLFGHADATAAFNVHGGHTDPGPNWRWYDLMAEVNNLLTPPPPPPAVIPGEPTMIPATPTLFTIGPLDENGNGWFPAGGRVYAATVEGAVSTPAGDYPKVPSVQWEDSGMADKIVLRGGAPGSTVRVRVLVG